MVCMMFVRKSIQLSAKFFGWTNLNQTIEELFISHESVMDTLEIPLLALFLQKVGDVGLLVSRLLHATVPVRSSFVYDVVKTGKEVHCALNEFLVLLTPFSQEVAARAADDAIIPV